MADVAHITSPPNLRELSGSSPPPDAPWAFEPVADAANEGDTFMPLGGVASDVVDGLAARRAAAAHPDADLIEKAGEFQTLCARERAAWSDLDETSSDAPAVKACRALERDCHDTGQALADIPARTSAGLAAKASAMLSLVGPRLDTSSNLAEHHLLVASILRDAAKVEAFTSTPSNSATDADLLALIVSHAPALAATTEAQVEVNAALARFNALAPHRPDAVLYRFDDPADRPEGCERHLNGYRMFYTKPDIEKLRSAPDPCHFSSGSIDSPEGPGMAWRPNKRLIARKAAILEAFDVWHGERIAVAAQVGWTAARAEATRLSAEARRIENAILEIETHTLAGVQAKAIWIEQQDKVEEWSNFVLYDLIGLDETGAATMDSTPTREVAEAYRTWLHFELRMLNLEMDGTPETLSVRMDNPDATYHFPTEGRWQDERKPSTRASLMLRILGIDIDAYWASARNARRPDRDVRVA